MIYHSTSGNSSVRIWRATWIGFGVTAGAAALAGVATALIQRRNT